MPTQKQLMLNHFAHELPKLKARFEEATGRFLGQNHGWQTTMQDVIQPLALLYLEPGADCHGRDDVFDLACRGGDCLRAAQDDAGRVEFVKPDGSRWGWTYMPWSMMHWLQTYGLLRDALDADRRARWEEGLLLAYGGVIEELSPERVHNIPAWHAAGLVHAGKLFDRPEWIDFGSALIHAVAAAQHPDGYWPESFGPTTLYNLVYVHAVGMYYQWTRDEKVLPCLERATDFHMHFTYPEGTVCETVDGRVKYHATPIAKGGPGFLAVPRGRRFFRDQMMRVISYREASQADPFSVRDTWDLQELADAYPYLDDAAAEAAAPALQDLRQFTALRNGRALVRRSGDWFYCLSGYLTPREKRSGLSRTRWNMDRQNYLGIWHEGSGLVVGGGNSKHQPELATFEVRTGPVSLCQADSAALRQEDGLDILRLVYGDTTTEVRLRPLDDALELTFALIEKGPATQEVLGGFTLPCLVNQTVRTSNHPEPATLAPLQVWGDAWEDEPGWIAWKSVRMETPRAYVRWPVYPFNPYAADDAAPADEALALVGFTLDPDAPQRRFVFRPERPMRGSRARA